MIMALNRLLKKIAGASGAPSRAISGRLRCGVSMAVIAVLGLSLLGTANAEDTSVPQTGSILFGTLDTQPSTVAAEASSSDVSVAMFEFDWASFEPSPGVFSASYMATMESYLQAYQSAGMRVTLGLGLEDPPSWVFSLPDATYVNQYGGQSNEANFVFSAAVRQAAAGYLDQIAADIPLSNFWAIRLTSGGDAEMLYPSRGAYWAFDNAALTGNGLAAGMSPNPDPNWTPGTPGLSQGQIDAWVNWYIGGLDNVTNWQMQTLSGLGFNGYYETVTPGSGTRPDGLAQDEQFNLADDGTTGTGAVWDRYYAMLPDKSNVIAYISSVADNSGDNDDCQSSDTSLPLNSRVMDSWSATRWISAIAHQNGLLIGGENPGYGMPAMFDFDYRDTSSSGMMADALSQAQSCGFLVFYWAHDVHLWDGTLPFSLYANSIAPYASPHDNLALAGSLAASNTQGGFPASNGDDNDLSTYWQAAEPTATLTLQLAQPSPVDRVLLELPENWPTREQTIEVDGSADGNTWTTLVPATTYTFTAGGNAVAITIPAGTQDDLRLDISGNTVMGAPQIAEFEAYSN
jgi:F5/8 type C domain